MRVIILCLLFLIPTIPTAIAEDKGIFYILDEKFIDNISELPASTNLKPDISWTPSNWGDLCRRDRSPAFIFGWIDIIGYRNMEQIDGQEYINEPVKDAAIIQYQTYSCVLGLAVFKLPMINTIETYQEGEQLVTKLTAKQVMYSIDQSGYINYYNLTKTFYDYEHIPKQINKLSGITANIVQYNNSLYENIGISIANISGLNKYTIQYQDNIATYRLKKAHVEQTAKGVYFANVTPAEFLDLKGKNMSRYGKTILLNGNLSKMSPGDIKITGSNLYETMTADTSQFNITRLEFKPETELENPVSIWFMSVMAVTAGGIYFYARRMTDQWLRNM
jgi:hypothetical protein